MIRTRSSDWRVQGCIDGVWWDYHAGTRAGPAIRAYVALDAEHKRLLRNGEPLRMSEPDQLDLT